MNLKLNNTKPLIYAKVDARDYRRLKKYRWTAQFAKNAIYVYRMGRESDGENRKIYLHRDIMKPLPGQCVDHINHDCLDNRRANLRIATYAENQANRRPMNISESGFPGVYKSLSRWRARIRINGKHNDLGTFDLPEIAAAIFQAKHIEIHGAFSIYNKRAEA